MSESLGLTSHKSNCNCTGCGMLRAGSASTAPRGSPRSSSSLACKNPRSTLARAPAARRSSCTSPRRQSAGAGNEHSS